VLREARRLIFQKNVIFLIPGAKENTVKDRRHLLPSEFSNRAPSCLILSGPPLLRPNPKGTSARS